MSPRRASRRNARNPTPVPADGAPWRLRRGALDCELAPGARARRDGFATTEAVANLTGHPAVPSFDLLHGGGVTMVLERSWWIVAALAAVTAHTALRHRDHPWIPKACAAGAALSGLLMVSGLDEPLQIEMGH